MTPLRTTTLLLLLATILADRLNDNADFIIGLTLGEEDNQYVDEANDIFDEHVDIGEANFNSYFYNSEHHIIKRECAQCISTHQIIYYSRHTYLTTFDVYNTMIQWDEFNNEMDIDFDLFSTLQDALDGINPWTHCNFDDPGIGAFRDCGPDEAIDDQWTGYLRGKSCRFSIYSPVTNVPTSIPTEQPTTNRPSWIPTDQPTTNIPTSIQTLIPTNIPTSIPTDQPTTNRPTLMPTEQPTTNRPTAIPTDQPTTYIPTSIPTTNSPSSIPTHQPTTNIPTSIPTNPAKPTEHPSTYSPTYSPTKSPSTLSDAGVDDVTTTLNIIVTQDGILHDERENIWVRDKMQIIIILIIVATVLILLCCILFVCILCLKRKRRHNPVPDRKLQKIQSVSMAAMTSNTMQSNTMPVDIPMETHSINANDRDNGDGEDGIYQNISSVSTVGAIETPQIELQQHINSLNALNDDDEDDDDMYITNENIITDDGMEMRGTGSTEGANNSSDNAVENGMINNENDDDDDDDLYIIDNKTTTKKHSADI